MSISFNGTNIENVTYNGTQLDKVIYNGVTVWENWKTGQFKQSKSFYNHNGVEQGTQTWDFDIGKLVLVESARIDATGSKYTLYGRASTSDSWTKLVDWPRKSGSLTSVSNSNTFRYFRLTCEYASSSAWEDPAGAYYWAYANNLTINYKYK